MFFNLCERTQTLQSKMILIKLVKNSGFKYFIHNSVFSYLLFLYQPIGAFLYLAECRLYCTTLINIIHVSVVKCLHLQPINIHPNRPAQLVDPKVHRLLPDASRNLLTSNTERNNQFYGVGQVQHTMLFISKEGVRTNVFILFCIEIKSLPARSGQLHLCGSDTPSL